MIWRKIWIPFTASLTVILIYLIQKLDEILLSTLNVPWINNDVIIARTKKKYIQSPYAKCD
jgi:hypothetical protein